MKSNIIDTYVWIISGKQRKTVLVELDKPKTATMIKDKTGIKVTNISDVLRAMVKNKLAIVLNSKDKRNRLYELTKLGHDVRKEIMS